MAMYLMQNNNVFASVCDAIVESNLAKIRKNGDNETEETISAIEVWKNLFYELQHKSV